MKEAKTLLSWAVLTASVLTASVSFSSCANDDTSSGVDSIVADENLETTAYNVLRCLCSLDEDADGIEELPVDWQNSSYEVDEGYVLDEESPSVRYVPSYSAEEACELYSDMVGEYVNSDSCIWNYKGIGRIELRTCSGESDGAFSVINLSLDFLPNLTQLRFVPPEIIESSFAENSYSGLPYYSAGDIIMRNKDSTYWICVRPAGGPLKKDKSYWICLNPLDVNGKNSLIKSTREKITYSYVGEKGNENVSETWKFAKNLMSLKTAKAAHHTFNLIANPRAWVNQSNPAGESIYKSLCAKKFDLRVLMNYKNLILDEDTDDEDEDADYNPRILRGSFCFAYGGVTKDSKRTVSGSKKNANTKYVQPFIYCTSLMDSNRDAYYFISEQVFTNDVFKDLYSVTNSFDKSFVAAQTEISAQKGPYDFEKFLHTVSADGLLGFPEKAATYAPENSVYAYHIIFSPELCIKDNKGSSSKALRPFDGSYTDIYHQEGDSKSKMDWWKSLETSVRHVNDKEVDWNKENE